MQVNRETIGDHSVGEPMQQGSSTSTTKGQLKIGVGTKEFFPLNTTPYVKYYLWK